MPDFHPEKKYLWIRLGVSLALTDEEANELFSGPVGEHRVIERLIQRGDYVVEGDTYVPDESVEWFNRDYGTNYTVAEYPVDL